MKPAHYANFNIVFARGRMVLAYSVSGLAAKKLPPIAEPGTQGVPKAAAKWYDVLTAPGVVISGGNPFLDPGAYRVPMIFQLAAEFYKVPNLYNNLLEHLMIPAQNSRAVIGKDFDFQFGYEHNVRATAAQNPDYRYVELPDEINMSDPAKDNWYRQHAVVVLPGLGTSRGAQSIPVPAAHVAWGVTIMNDAPHKENAIRFLQMLLGPAGTASLNENGPSPISPALISEGDLRKLPAALRPLVKAEGKR
jgi:molybdate/tungstate transport system substrate-binding protein